MRNERYFKKELKVEGELKNLSLISQFIIELMQQWKMDKKIIYQTQMAVDEACSNIIIHGYSQKTGKINLIYCMIQSNKSPLKIIIKIQDDGKKLDMDNVPDPDLDADLETRTIGGLGVFFIKKIMDDVQYSSYNGKNQLKLVKFVK